MGGKTAGARNRLQVVREEPDYELVDEEDGTPLMREHGSGFREQVRRVICDPEED